MNVIHFPIVSMNHKLQLFLSILSRRSLLCPREPANPRVYRAGAPCTPIISQALWASLFFSLSMALAAWMARCPAIGSTGRPLSSFSLSGARARPYSSLPAVSLLIRVHQCAAEARIECSRLACESSRLVQASRSSKCSFCSPIIAARRGRGLRQSVFFF